MDVVRLVVITVVLMTSSVSCASEQKSIYYYNACDDPEVSADIDQSILGLEKFAEDNRIDLIHMQGSSKCGYLFVIGSTNRYIGSVMTDIDLMMLSNEFFHLEENQ